MKTKTHFAFRIDVWDNAGNSIVEHVAGVLRSSPGLRSRRFAPNSHTPARSASRMSNACVVVSLTTASFVARKTSARVGLQWCHLLWKSICFSMCAGNTYWCHFSAKSLEISTNGLVRSESGVMGQV